MSEKRLRWPAHAVLAGAAALMSLGPIGGSPSAGRVAAAEPPAPVYGLDEVAAHNSLESCWMAIEGQVYDVTGHIPTHPTPPEMLAPWCGRDATEGFRTKGYGQEHSPAAWGLLEIYRIGTLAAP